MKRSIYLARLYLYAYWSQLVDKNAGARPTLKQRCRRGHRIGLAYVAIVRGPPYKMPRWQRKWEADHDHDQDRLAGNEDCS
jgi:hypothetical protein